MPCDKLIADLGDVMRDSRKQAMCHAALAARFKLQAEIPEGMFVRRLPLLYKLFAQVPAEHVGHDMLAKLEVGTEPVSNQNFYWATGKKIVLEPKIDKDVDQDYVRQDGTGAKETLKST
jgi:hypothetical protein